MNDWRTEAAAMRAALPRTWYAFFARFKKPRPVQLASWRPLIEGHDCVVCSPTASGKTEAVVAPLVERHLTGSNTIHHTQHPNQGFPRLLLVSPTRALVNDLKRRLEQPFARIGLKIDRRTGDHAHLDRQNPPQALITTPESLDSLLVRHRDFLNDIQAVIIDELHILDGSARGDQMRVLLQRLRAIKSQRKDHLQVVASSATIDDPRGLAGRYLTDGQLVICGGAKKLDHSFIQCRSPVELLLILEKIWGAGPGQYRKILVFLASRADVEQAASLASDHQRLRSRVLAHHGSLSRNERERVEARFATDPSAICFATMTLELGIDIGDVDQIVLGAVPSSVSSLLQRIGRGSRRKATSQVLACYRNPGDLTRLQHLFDLAERGELCPPPYVFSPSVLVQQAGSLLLQSRGQWLSGRVFESKLPQDLADKFNADRLSELFSALTAKEWLAPGRNTRFVAGELLLRAFDRGEMHGNLGREAPTMDVVDDSTGRSLGHVALDTGASSKSVSNLTVAGRSRTVVRTGDKQVWVADAKSAPKTRFAPRGRQSISRELARSLARFIGLKPDRLMIVETPGGLAVLHFQGTLAGLVLARHLKRKHSWPKTEGRSLALIVRSFPTDTPPVIGKAALAAEIPALAKSLGNLAGAGRYHRDLPSDWQNAYLQEVIHCDDIATKWSQASFVEPKDDKQREMLISLAGVR